MKGVSEFGVAAQRYSESHAGRLGHPPFTAPPQDFQLPVRRGWSDTHTQAHTGTRAREHRDAHADPARLGSPGFTVSVCPESVSTLRHRPATPARQQHTGSQCAAVPGCYLANPQRGSSTLAAVLLVAVLLAAVTPGSARRHSRTDSDAVHDPAPRHWAEGVRVGWLVATVSPAINLARAVMFQPTGIQSPLACQHPPP